MGGNKFKLLWEEITNSPLPDWLSETPLTIEDSVLKAIQAGREKRPVAEKYYSAFQKIADDPNIPAQDRELGRVMLRIMAGEVRVDLSNLPDHMRENIRKALE